MSPSSLRSSSQLRRRTAGAMLFIPSRSLATKATGQRGTRRALQKPALRRNAKRIHEAIAQTAIPRVAQSLARATPLRVLGLDINTNSTGYAVLDNNGRVTTWGHIATTQFASADILAIAHAITDELRHVHDETVEWRVGIEDFMRMYRFGKFHNKGIFQLAQLNGIVSYTCWQRFGARPVHTHPTAARALFGIVATTKTSKNVKDQVMAHVLAQEHNSAAVQQLRTDYVNRYGQWTDAAYDIADAYVVAAYTRWMALQDELQADPELLSQFSVAYLELAAPSTTKKASTVEATALQTMDETTKRTYLHGLYASGVADWIKATASTERVN